MNRDGSTSTPQVGRTERLDPALTPDIAATMRRLVKAIEANQGSGLLVREIILAKDVMRQDMQRLGIPVDSF